MNSSQLPVQYIVKDGTSIVLNTRSSAALLRGGVRTPFWSATDVTAELGANLRLANQLANNPGAPTSAAMVGRCRVSFGK
jgi:hypothetical protein